MVGRKVVMKILLLIACGITFVESRPGRGEQEGLVSEKEPARVAEADKTTYSISRSDVLTPEEKKSLEGETMTKAILHKLKDDSKLTDLSNNFLNELASNKKCEKEMEILGRCLRNKKAEKVAINTVKVSLEKQSDVKKVSFQDSDGQTYTVDEDCTNNQIDLETCIIQNNRYYPCEPPAVDLSKYKNIFIQRTKKLAGILEKQGFILNITQANEDFGKVDSYEITNFDEAKYGNIVKDFLAEFKLNDLPEPYESLKDNLSQIESIVPNGSLNFNKLKEAFRSNACKQNIPDVADVKKSVEAVEKKFKKPSAELKAAFETFNKSFEEFLEKFPKEVEDTCSNDGNHQNHVTNKIAALELLNLTC